MALNYVWVGFFLVAFVVALIKLIFFGDTEIFRSIGNATFDYAKTGFEISLFLTGVLTFWLGLMKIGVKAGMVGFLSRLMHPVFSTIFPEIPKNHPAAGSIMMNFAANMLGLDNAATPMGLKAMEQMQELNPKKERASNAQIMFLVLNTSSLTLLPVSIMAYRAQQGAGNPSDIFLPILLSTYFSTMVGLLVVSIYQKINIFKGRLLVFILAVSVFVFGLLWYFSTLSQQEVETLSAVISYSILFSFIIAFILAGLVKKINVFETFIEGAKEGFTMAVKIIPYLVGILVAIGVFRVCGALEIIVDGLAAFFSFLGVNTDFVGALPTALMRPLSGSGARSMMIEVMVAEGADSFVGRLACIVQGANDTTFYILALYFGSVGIKNSRYALQCGLLADLAGIVAAILIGYQFFY